MAPVVRALEASEAFESLLCVTGQHRGMLDQVLDLFELEPRHDLDLMRERQTLAGLTARALTGIAEILAAERPDVVLVQGDTTTTFAGALAAFYAGIPSGHVEAGLRTGDLAAPFPEEANRLLTGRLARLHFVPTERCRRALAAEGVAPERIWLTGNTVVDALLWVRDKLGSTPLEQDRDALGSAYQAVAADPPLVLVTGHRRESFGAGFEGICFALKMLAEKHPEIEIVYPVHLNPEVQQPVRRTLADLPNVHLLAPLSYGVFARLMNRCKFILSDSGGIQEEAPALGKPVLVMREVTERQEAIEAGTARLVGSDPKRIVGEAERLLTDAATYRAMSRAHNAFGDGRAAERIVDALASVLG